MVIQFWLGAILLLIIASAIFVTPFLATKKEANNNHDKRNQLNRALYDTRLAELEQDDQQGLLIDKDKIVSELQHNLLDDISDEQIVSTSSTGKLMWLPGLLLLILGSVAMYWSVGAYQEVAKWENTLQRYPALQDKLFNDASARPTEQDLRDIMLGLRTSLASDPEDAQGWLLYSRLGMVFKDTNLAVDAIQKAYALDPASTDIVLVYAQLKMQSGDELEAQQAEQMIELLLISHPEELDAWSMYAFMALEQQDFRAAINRWKKMLTLIDGESEQANMLRGSISYAEKQLQSQQLTAQVTTVEPEVVAPTVQQVAPKAQFDEAGEPIYTINISAADDVTIPQSGVLIAYAQAVSGSKMPIAAVKIEISQLPVSIVISDADAMMQGMNLSAQSEFVIKARLSQTGNVTRQEGDWQGGSAVIKKGQLAPVNITINEQL